VNRGHFRSDGSDQHIATNPHISADNGRKIQGLGCDALTALRSTDNSLMACVVTKDHDHILEILDSHPLAWGMQSILAVHAPLLS
jgi:hypothetical protein